MSPLRYKQRRQLINALRRSTAGPRQALALLVALAYGAASLGMVAALLVAPLPDFARAMIDGLIGVGAMEDRLRSLRGGLTLSLLLLATTAAFQNPLLQFARADVDLLFATPVPAWRPLLGKLQINHLRTLLAGYFFWGIGAAPALRLLGYAPWPAGLWAIFGLACLFASIDQAFALGLIISGEEADGRRLLFARAGLLIVGAGLGLLGLGGVSWLLGGGRSLLDLLLGIAGGATISGLLLPLGLASDLLLLPLRPDLPHAALALGGLALLDLISGGLLIVAVARGGAGALMETVLAPKKPGLGDLLREIGPRPLRILAALWGGEVAAAAPDDLARPTRARPARLLGPAAQIWRRGVEIRRAPVRSTLAVLALGLIPLWIYGPERGHSLARLLTALVFSTSLSTQIFNDAADHLRYASLELSMPAARWRTLLMAMLPRLLLYWLGGAVLLIGAGLRAPDTAWPDILALALYDPLILASLVSLRAALVFIWPAAGIPGQRDPLQALIVLLANGLLVLLVIALALLPFGVVIALIQILGVGGAWLWPVVFACGGMLALASVSMMCWAYGRYEPAE
ncbi:hypothetical protein K2Z83_01955 [Oscillochloris sp. ZM17-4]|uniref:hypothetical protein n=1 Tax=Oscillochloris sp. ZM17-4 TaxID=2866714 RepID=UPI001C73B228|nr:hypothetical protein [Oscillochloris sp. ZM17-4]MBX0326458.1 hypothetical protein [Oscillochloris sp. ZM17-4]